MRNMRKQAAILLTMAIGAGVLSGCGSQQSAGESGQKTETAQTAAVLEAQAEAAAQTGEAAQEEDPFLTGEKPVLNILFTISRMI